MRGAFLTNTLVLVSLSDSPKQTISTSVIFVLARGRETNLDPYSPFAATHFRAVMGFITPRASCELALGTRLIPHNPYESTIGDSDCFGEHLLTLERRVAKCLVFLNQSNRLSQGHRIWSRIANNRRESSSSHEDSTWPFSFAGSTLY